MNLSPTLQVLPQGENEIVLKREFKAPRQLVFEAWTRPELLRRWFGKFGGWALTVCEVDLRVGGSWRFVLSGPDQARMGMSGVYREIVPAERLVSSERFDEAWHDGEAVSSLIFTEQQGITTVTNTVHYASSAIRDAVLKTNMAKGVSAGYDTLEAVLAELLAEGQV